MNITDRPLHELQDGKTPITTTSLKVAQYFGKRHDNVLQAYETALKSAVKADAFSAEHNAKCMTDTPQTQCSPSALRIEDTSDEAQKYLSDNITMSEYVDEQGKSRPMLEMTKGGFSLLAFAFTGARAFAFRVAFLKEFERMEAHIKEFDSWRKEVAERSIAKQDMIIALEHSRIDRAQRRKEKAMEKRHDEGEKACLVSIFGFDPALAGYKV